MNFADEHAYVPQIPDIILRINALEKQSKAMHPFTLRSIAALLDEILGTLQDMEARVAVLESCWPKEVIEAKKPKSKKRK